MKVVLYEDQVAVVVFEEILVLVAWKVIIEMQSKEQVKRAVDVVEAEVMRVISVTTMNAGVARMITRGWTKDQMF